MWIISLGEKPEFDLNNGKKKRLQYLKTHGSTSGMVVWNLVVGAGDVEPLTSSYLEKVLSCGFVDLSIRRQRASAHCATGKRRSRVLRAQVTSMYLLPIWCLCLCSARSLCSSLTKRTRASPFLLPWALRHSAAPPLQNTTQGGCGRCANSLDPTSACACATTMTTTDGA